MALASQNRVNLASHGPGTSRSGVAYARYTARKVISVKDRARRMRIEVGSSILDEFYASGVSHVSARISSSDAEKHDETMEDLYRAGALDQYITD